MALGAEDVQPAQLPYLVAFGPAFLFVLGEKLVETSDALLARELEALGPDGLLGQALGVATEQDVDAAAGHVGGHGDLVQPTGLGDHSRLPEVLLGVEDLMGDAALGEQPRQDL